MSFDFEPLEIPDVVLVRPTRHEDERGWLMETFRASTFTEIGLPGSFAQNNFVRSGRGVLRGMHFQAPPAAQGKLVTVQEGEIFDVAVDLRQSHGSYGRWVGRVLNARSAELLWVPPGFAHGYQVLSDRALVAYQLTSEFRPDLDRGFRWDDPVVGIDWPLPTPILSPKDRTLPTLQMLGTPFDD